MQIEIRSNGHNPTDEIKEYAIRSFSRLGRIAQKPVDQRVEVRLGKEGNPAIEESFYTSALMTAWGKVLKVEASGTDPAMAIDRASDQLLERLRRRHDKIKRKVKKPAV